MRIGPPKSVELLAVLLMAPGHRASHADITAFLWPGEYPISNRIRQSFFHIRKNLPDITARNDPGYCRIQADPQTIDYVRFQGFVRAADVAGDASARLKALRLALGEWQGTLPLPELPDAFDPKRAQLVAELRDATVACVRAELECGETVAALDRARMASSHWPDDESLLELGVRALCHLNRHDEVEPLLDRWEHRFGRSVVHLLLAVKGDGLDSAAATAVAPSVPTRPWQLPARPPDFVGREPELDRVAATLLGRTPGRSRVAVLTGMPGVGKTMLAQCAADRVGAHFPDGILYADLGGFSPRDPERHGPLLARFLNDLRVRPATPTMDGMVSAYRTALADRAVLLILDNVRDEDHVRPLLPGLGAGAAIVTSRRVLHGLAIREGAELVEVGPLDRAEATELLRACVGDDRMRTARPFLGDVVDHCGGLPLALAIMAARIAQRPPQALPGMVRELRQESTRLRSLDLGLENLSIRLAFEVSYKLLSTSAARLLRQLAVHPGPSVSWSALRAFDPDDAVGISDAIDDLMRMSLVTEPTSERYSLHDLVRVYAGELAEGQDEAERARAVECVLRFLLHNAWACDRRLDPGRRLPVDEPRTGETVAPAHAVEAMSWFETEYPTLTAAIGMAGQRGLDRYTWLLPMTLVTFQWRSGRYVDALKHLTEALPAAEREAGPADVAMVHRMLAGTHRGLGNQRQALLEFRVAVRVSEGDGDVPGIAIGRHALGVLLRETGAPTESLAQFVASLSAFEQLDDPLGRGAALNGIASARYDLGQYDEALDHGRRALDALDGTEDFNGQAHALFSLGRMRVSMGEYAAAVADFRRSRGLYASLAYTSREARALVWLADALHGAGRTGEGAEAIEQARALLARMGESDLDVALDRLRFLP